MGLLPLFHRSEASSKNGEITKEMEFPQIGRLFLEFQSQALKQKLALAEAHGFKPEFNFDLDSFAAYETESDL